MTASVPSSAPPEAPLVNIPNGLTLLRLLLVPVFGWLLLTDGGTDPGLRVAAAVVFVFASITDFVDGAIARRRNLVTNFGKIADPIADKALTGMALIGLSLLGDLAWWITAVIIGREVSVTLLRFAVISDGVIPASRGGKAKTVTQIIAISMYLLPLTGQWATLATAVMAVAVALTVVTGIDYAARAVAVRRRGELMREAFRTP